MSFKEFKGGICKKHIVVAFFKRMKQYVDVRIFFFILRWQLVYYQ